MEKALEHTRIERRHRAFRCHREIPRPAEERIQRQKGAVDAAMGKTTPPRDLPIRAGTSATIERLIYAVGLPE